MQRLEAQPNSLSLFEGVRKKIGSQVKKVDDATFEAWSTIERQILDAAFSFEEGAIPDAIDIADITPHITQSPRIRYILQYRRKESELSMIAREIRRVEYDPFMAFPNIGNEKSDVRLFREEQSERVLRKAEPAEWVKYGPLLATKLEEAVQNARSLKK